MACSLSVYVLCSFPTKQNFQSYIKTSQVSQPTIVQPNKDTGHLVHTLPIYLLVRIAGSRMRVLQINILVSLELIIVSKQYRCFKTAS